MPDFLTQDIELFISKIRESSFNLPITVGTDFLRATTQSPTVYIPEPEFTNDANRAGNASEFPTGRCLKRFLSETIGITDRASFDLYGRLAMRCAGGAPLAVVTLSGGVFQHAANMLPKSAGLQLPSMNAITAIGGASYLWPGVVVNDFTLSQNADEDMQVAFNLIGSGKHRSPHLVGIQQVETATAVGTVGAGGAGNAKAVITAAGMSGSPRTVLFAVANNDTAAQWADKCRIALAADPTVSGFFIVSGTSTSIVLTARHTAPNDTTMNIATDNDTSTGITPSPTSANTTAGSYTLPAAPGFACLDTKPFLEYNDGLLQDLTTGCRWRNWSAGLNNNHNPQRDRCGGDPRQKRGDYTVTTGVGVGAYLQKLTRNPRAVTAEITYLVNENLREWEQLCDNVQLTGATFGARGALLGGGFYEALKIVIPKAKFGVLRGTDSDGFAAFTLSFETEFDATAIGARVEVINADAGVSPLFN